MVRRAVHNAFVNTLTIGTPFPFPRVCPRIDYKVSVLTYKTPNMSVPQPTHQPPRQRTDTTLDGYATARPTVRSAQLRETFFWMRSAVCLKLTSCICHRKRVTVFKSWLKYFYFVVPLTSTQNRLPPAPPKLRPYGALQIYLLLLLLLLLLSTVYYSKTQTIRDTVKQYYHHYYYYYYY